MAEAPQKAARCRRTSAAASSHAPPAVPELLPGPESRGTMPNVRPPCNTASTSSQRQWPATSRETGKASAGRIRPGHQKWSQPVRSRTRGGRRDPRCRCRAPDAVAPIRVTATPASAADAWNAGACSAGTRRGPRSRRRRRRCACRALGSAASALRGRRRQRQVGEAHARGAAAGRAHAGEVLGQAVGDVHGGGGVIAQRRPGQARLRAGRSAGAGARPRRATGPRPRRAPGPCAAPGRAPHRRGCRRRTARRPAAPCRAAPCGPRSTSPMTVMEIVSGPGRRSVSPPIRWQPKRACAAARPAAKRASQPASAPRETTAPSDSRAGRAALAARSETFTASAFQAMSSGASSARKCTPSATGSVLSTSSVPGAGVSSAQSSSRPKAPGEPRASGARSADDRLLAVQLLVLLWSSACHRTDRLAPTRGLTAEDVTPAPAARRGAACARGCRARR